MSKPFSRQEVNKFVHKVDTGSGITADYVVAHAKRQSKKGKSPSTPYRDETNPQKALMLATEDISKRDAYIGSGYCGRVAVVHTWNETQAEIGRGVSLIYGAVGETITPDMSGVPATKNLHPDAANNDGTTDTVYHWSQ